MPGCWAFILKCGGIPNGKLSNTGGASSAPNSLIEAVLWETFCVCCVVVFWEVELRRPVTLPCADALPIFWLTAFTVVVGMLVMLPIFWLILFIVVVA